MARTILFIIYIIFGVYFLNKPYNFLKLPATFLTTIEPWIIFVGGILLIIGAINYLRATSYRRRRF